jgi:hypothetical protein
MMLCTMTNKFVTDMKPETVKGKKVSNKKSKKVKVTDMRVCPTCGKVWSFYHDGNMIRFKSYTGIPKYGLPKLECPNCEETK